MKLKWDSNYFTIAVYSLIVICFSILFYIFVTNIGNIFDGIKKIIYILSPIIWGLGLAYLFNPLLDKIEKFIKKYASKIKRNKFLVRTISMIITYLLVITLICAFLYIVVPQIITTLTYLLNNLPEYIKNLEKNNTNVANKNGIFYVIISKLLDYTEHFFTQTYAFLGNTLPKAYDIAKNITKTVMDIIIGLVVSVYILGSKEIYFFQTRKFLKAIFSKNTVDTILSLNRSVHTVFSGFIIGKILNSIIVGLVCFIGMTIFRFPFSPLISVLVGVTNIIPYFGPIIGAIPSILLIMVLDPIKGLLFAIFILVLQQIDGNYLGPKILGETTGLSPFWVIFSIILFGGLFGIFGMFVGIPIFAIIYSLVKCFINDSIKNKKEKIKLIEENKDLYKTIDEK